VDKVLLRDRMSAPQDALDAIRAAREVLFSRRETRGGKGTVRAASD
jgi:hypothetical protein